MEACICGINNRGAVVARWYRWCEEPAELSTFVAQMSAVDTVVRITVDIALPTTVVG